MIQHIFKMLLPVNLMALNANARMFIKLFVDNEVEIRVLRVGLRYEQMLLELLELSVLPPSSLSDTINVQ